MRPNTAFCFCLLFIAGLCTFSSRAGWTQPVVSYESTAGESAAQAVNAHDADKLGTISGTVEDVYGDVVSGVTVELQTPTGRKTTTADDNGFFHFEQLTPGSSYRVTVSAAGFESWVGPSVTLKPGQFFELTGIHLKLQEAVTSVTVTADPVEIATEQVQVEMKQRILGFVPNFYVVYDSQNAAPMTTKLKYKMAIRVAVDPISIVGAMALAGMNQAGNTPDFQQGWKGYAQRFGAAYTDGTTDIMFGGAILPSLLHQDPRYFYQGTGTVGSRLRHALANPFLCKGDNGRRQPNYSSMGGDLISSSLSNLYYPSSNRGPGLVFNSFLISTGTRELSSIMQEFVLRKLTPSAAKSQE